MKKALIISLLIVVSVLTALEGFTEDNTAIRGYEKPEVCLKSNIRCILKQRGETLYWCLKSNQQRTLDARRTTKPLKKTTDEILGHCAKIIPIRE
ncbi:hypothetical protein KKA14_16305 [bacterium]|nr:hypothetical protein [bacterium]